jgi:Uma2 family endonuclease
VAAGGSGGEGSGVGVNATGGVPAAIGSGVVSGAAGDGFDDPEQAPSSAAAATSAAIDDRKYERIAEAAGEGLGDGSKAWTGDMGGKPTRGPGNGLSASARAPASPAARRKRWLLRLRLGMLPFVVNPAKRRATYEDLLLVPEHLVAEIVDGELHTSPRPGKPHALATSVLGEELGPPFRRGRGGPGGWILLDEPELHLGGDVLVPDLAGWRRERMPVLTDELPYFELAPDWICEVLSPSTHRLDRTSKVPSYARAAVGHLWLVDPLQRLLEVMRLEHGRWSLLGTWAEDARVRAEPFEDFELELGLLWQDVLLPTAR